MKQPIVNVEAEGAVIRARNQGDRVSPCSGGGQRACDRPPEIAPPRFGQVRLREERIYINWQHCPDGLSSIYAKISILPSRALSRLSFDRCDGGEPTAMESPAKPKSPLDGILITSWRQVRHQLNALIRLERELSELRIYLQVHRENLQVHREKEQHTGRKLDVADLLFDTLGAPSELGPHDISLILHFLKYLLTCLLFCNFSIFPGTIRPRCTTMPWTIWPALVVLWGVCWMFNPRRSDAQFEHSGTSHSEIENSQPGEFGISIHSRCQISGSRKASGSITEGISTAVQETAQAVILSLCGDRLFAVTLPFL
jgi:hypothetical protein